MYIPVPEHSIVLYPVPKSLDPEMHSFYRKNVFIKYKEQLILQIRQLYHTVYI
jgi:hypothetical protein